MSEAEIIQNQELQLRMQSFDKYNENQEKNLRGFSFGPSGTINEIEDQEADMSFAVVDDPEVNIDEPKIPGAHGSSQVTYNGEVTNIIIGHIGGQQSFATNAS